MSTESTYAATQSLPMSQEALEAMPFPFAIYTSDGLYVGANALMEQLLITPRSAGIGSFNLLANPQTRDDGSREYFMAAVAGQHVKAPPAYFAGTFPETSQSGRSGCWVETYYTPFRDVTGRVTHVGAITQDISERVERERELRLTKFTLDRAPDAVYWIAPNGRFAYVNDAACTMLGYSRAELLQLTVADLDPVDPLNDFNAVWQQFKLDGNQHFETVHRRKAGDTIAVEVVSSFVEFEGQKYGCLFARDISARKRAEHEIRLMKLSLDHAVDSVHWLTPDWNIVYANDTACAMLGYSRDEMLTMSLFDIAVDLTPEIMVIAWDETKKGTFAVEGIHRHKNGQQIPVDVVVTYLVLEGQEYACTFARDISERKRAEAERTMLQEQVIAAQQAALRELSTPLIPIAAGVVVMPLIGGIDSNRAQLVVETLLTGTAELRAHTTIIDITGVPVVDTQVANALLRAAQAVKLLGARVILTGIRPEVAQTLVGLGVDLSGIMTRGTLQAGIAEALRRRPTLPQAE